MYVLSAVRGELTCHSCFAWQVLSAPAGCHKREHCQFLRQEVNFLPFDDFVPQKCVWCRPEEAVEM